MQTVSPQLLHAHSPGDSTAQGPTFQDPYLSAPSDPDDDFKSTGIRLTPSQGEASNHHPTPDGSSPCSNGGSARGLGDPMGASDGPDFPTGSCQGFLSPPENVFSSDLSTYTPSNGDGLIGGLGVNWDSAQLSAERPSNSSQLLTPGMTNQASPASDVPGQNMYNSVSDAQLALHNALDSARPQHQTLTVSVENDGLNAQDPWDPDSARARSPIVKVESFSRGDSPVRGFYPSGRRHSQSSTHLSPGGPNESSSGSDEEYVEGRDADFGQPISRSHDGSWIPNTATGQAGVGPTSRSDVYVQSPSEMELQRQMQYKIADIQSWSVSVSAANSPPGTGKRPRARSAGNTSDHRDYFNYKLQVNDSNIPGPGILVYESSNEDLSEPESEMQNSMSNSPTASVTRTERDQAASGNVPGPGQPNPDGEEPSPTQFLRVRPWQDTAQDLSPRTARMQPHTSNAAMVEFHRRAMDIDNASRSATWGTQNLLESFDSLSMNDQNKKKERRPSLRKFFPMKTANNLKRQLSQISINQPHLPPANDGAKDDETGSPQRKDSSSSHRKLSIGRSHQRSPSLSTQNAVIAIAGQMAAIGGRNSVNAASPSGGTSPWSAPRKNRERSRSEIPSASAPSLIDLMSSQGGPPVAGLAYSAKATGNNDVQVGRHESGGNPVDDGEDDDPADEKGQAMDFPSVSHLPVPTLEGFRTQIVHLNPRLQQVLIERLANEQLRRYKFLVETKSNHSRVASQKQCMAGKYCFAQGGDAALLPPKLGPQDIDGVHTQFQIPGQDGADETGTPGESAVTPAQFPNGVPLPPVKQLPAEFECPVCFKVRKFQKPSDWTKHVHEDLQPFTCTFPDCNEPKSFKRKADWVRHENERHRKLEWWTCTIPDCHHTCFRKDNFVKHLVREHKMPEPRAKRTKAKGRNAVANGSLQMQEEEKRREREIEKQWALVESCRRDTSRTPREEPCRFCGNICSSWKKLTVHLAKHMEQIAMPVLQLVKERDFSITTSTQDAPSIPTSYQGGAQDGRGTGLNTAQEEYIDQANSAALTCPRIVQNEVMSAEPEPIDAFDMAQYSQLDISGAFGNHSQFMPVHQNSVTYPPPFNAVPRPRSSNQGMDLLQDPYQYLHSRSPSQMGSGYDAQGPLYMPTAEVPFDPSTGAGGSYARSRGGDYM